MTGREVMSEAVAPSVEQEQFGVTLDGAPVQAFTLRGGGIEVRVMEYGATLLSIRAPDRDGTMGEVILGYDDVASYERGTAYIGGLCGRFAGRIARSRFMLDGRQHQLTPNAPPHHLHGGARGFNHVRWHGRVLDSPRGDACVELSYESVDGEEGYPGTVSVTCRLSLDASGALWLRYCATTDEATPLNLTHHPYFNLSGDPATDILAHELTVRASRYLRVDSTLIPRGHIADVARTPFDFRAPTPIGARIDAPSEQLEFGVGYDHSLVLDAGAASEAEEPAILLHDPGSGRVLEIQTSEPALHVYSGNYLDRERSRAGGSLRRHAGVALEAQRFPDAPNQPAFPSAILRPGAPWEGVTSYRFRVSSA